MSCVAARLWSSQTSFSALGLFTSEFLTFLCLIVFLSSFFMRAFEKMSKLAVSIGRRGNIFHEVITKFLMMLLNQRVLLSDSG